MSVRYAMLCFVNIKESHWLIASIKVLDSQFYATSSRVFLANAFCDTCQPAHTLVAVTIRVSSRLRSSARRAVDDAGVTLCWVGNVAARSRLSDGRISGSASGERGPGAFSGVDRLAVWWRDLAVWWRDLAVWWWDNSGSWVTSRWQSYGDS